MREARVSIVNTRRASGPKVGRDALLDMARERIARVAADGADLVLLSELFATNPDGHGPEDAARAAEEVDGPVGSAMAECARRHSLYVAFGLLRRQGGRLFNSLVLLDRAGTVVWVYDKVSPVPFEMTGWGETPGTPSTYRCDFGTVGAAICFDINFGERAEIYQRKGVELLLFASAFPAGRLLDAWAIRHGFAIASSTYYDDNRILDCAGATVARTSDLRPQATAVLNLDRKVVHMDGNLDRIERVKAKHGRDVIVEDLRDEALMVVTSLRKGLDIGQVLAEFEIQSLSDYLDASRRVRAGAGGLKPPKWD